METRETIVFNKVQITDMDINNIVNKFESQRYTEELGIGFTYVHLEDNTIAAKVLVRTPSYIQNYNLHENVFEKNIVNIYDEIEIVLDFLNGLIYSNSSTTKFNKAKGLIQKCLRPHVVFNNIECSAETMIKNIQSLGWTPRIVELSIKKFVYKEGAVGRLSLHFNNAELGNELYEIYSKNLAKLTILVESSVFSDFILSITSQNSLTIRSDESELWQIINKIKQTI